MAVARFRLPRANSSSGNAKNAVTGSRLYANTSPRPPSRTEPSRSTTRVGEPGGPGSMRNRASQSSARTIVTKRRPDAGSTSTVSTRSRVDGTAQMTSAAMPRYENTSTDDVTSIDAWNTMASHTAA